MTNTYLDSGQVHHCNIDLLKVIVKVSKYVVSSVETRSKDTVDAEAVVGFHDALVDFRSQIAHCRLSFFDQVLKNKGVSGMLKSTVTVKSN